MRSCGAATTFPKSKAAASTGILIRQLPALQERPPVRRQHQPRLGACLPVRRRQIERAPFDAQVVAGPRQNLLLRGRCAQRRHCSELVTAHVHALVRRIHGQLRRSVELQLYFVRAGVCAVHFKANVGDRAREQIEVVGQRGRQEGQRQPHARSRELVARRGRRDLQAGLFERLQFRGFGAGEPIRRAVDADETGQRLRRAGPVARDAAGQLVAERPHAEVRVVRDERNGRGAQWSDLGRQTRERGDQERE